MKKLLIFLLPLLLSCEAEVIDQATFTVGTYKSIYFPSNYVKINADQTITINIEGNNFTTNVFTVDYNSIYLVYEGQEYKIFKTTVETEVMVTSGELNFGWFKLI